MVFLSIPASLLEVFPRDHLVHPHCLVPHPGDEAPRLLVEEEHGGQVRLPEEDHVKVRPHDDEVVAKGDRHEGEGGEDTLGLFDVRGEIGNYIWLKYN